MCSHVQPATEADRQGLGQHSRGCSAFDRRVLAGDTPKGLVGRLGFRSELNTGHGGTRWRGGGHDATGPNRPR